MLAEGSLEQWLKEHDEIIARLDAGDYSILEAWKDCGSKGMLILLEDDLVTYAELEFRFFRGDRKIIDCDTIEELLVVGKALKDFHQDKDDYSWI